MQPKVVQTENGWYVVTFHWLGAEFDSKPMRNPGPANQLCEKIREALSGGAPAEAPALAPLIQSLRTMRERLTDRERYVSPRELDEHVQTVDEFLAFLKHSQNQAAAIRAYIEEERLR